jgi:hypothetical protein
MNPLALSAKSSSHVSIRSMFSGPVSSIFCLPTLPQRGCTVGSSTLVAKLWMTPRGLTVSMNLPNSSSGKYSNVGDSFSGSLAQSVHVKGVTVLKAGTPVSGIVVAARKQGKFKGEGDLGIQLNRVGSYGITTQEYERTVKGKGKRTGAMVGGGAGGGALIGGLAGGGKGALIGGLVGAGAGTAGAALTGNKAVSIPAETVVTFTLTSPITVTEKPKSREE